MWNQFQKNRREQSPAEQGRACGHGKDNRENPREMDPKKAHIYNLIIVDESGSMSSLTRATIDGINETIGTIKKAQEDFADTQQHFLSLVTFDERSGVPPVRNHYDEVPIGDIDGFNEYEPYGCTPLYDALGESLTRLHNRIKDDDNATGVVTIITDGLENASRKWSGDQVRKLIEQLKAEGWTFSYMGSTHDVKSVTVQLSIEHVVEFDHDVKGASNTWLRDSSSKRAYYERMNRDFNADEAIEMKRAKLRANASAYFAQRVTPDWIKQLPDNSVFVFGSNEQGNHAGGAAAFAVRHFGAVNGQGEGLQGQSYAIPTTGSFDRFAQAVERFIEYAAAHPDQRFLVTRVGCGHAGYPVPEVAHLFTNAIKLENVCLPEDFWAVLGLKMM